MKRWGLVFVVLAVVTGLAWQRYQVEVASLTPQAFLTWQGTEPVRVLGRVQAGSLTLRGGSHHFRLEANGVAVAVSYAGPDAETLRELKTILAQGVRQADGSLRASQVTIAPNYGYIAAAFGGIGMLLLVFAWAVENRLHAIQRALREGVPS